MFKYKIPRQRIEPERLGKPNKQGDGEYLSGYVNGLKASDIEERFAIALRKKGKDFAFRVPVISPRHMLGQLELDFLIMDVPFYYPVQIDGSYAHKNESKQQEDMKKDILVEAYLKKQFNVMPIKRIKGIELETQEQANLKVEDMLL